MPLFPIVQDQWLNISLLDKSSFTNYSLLYYSSGLLFPLIILYISFKNFNNYKFEDNKSLKNKKEFKFLFYQLSLVLILLSSLLTKYFLNSIQLLNKSTLNGEFDIKYQIITLVIIMILLFFENIKVILKNIFLINFFILYIIIWTNYYINLNDGNSLLNLSFFNISILDIQSINLFNVIFIYTIEILYYLFSFFTFKNNISNWSVSYPTKKDIKPFYRISIFYLGIFIYYFIFNGLS